MATPQCQNVLDICSKLGNCTSIDASCKVAVIKDKTDIESTILVAFAGFTVLLYDHIITFDDELTYVWFRKKGIPGYLFLINRYLIPLGFIVNLYAYQGYGWSPASCYHFVRYEGVMTVTGINIASLLMLFRVKALYKSNYWVVGFVGAILLIEFGVNVSLLVHATSVKHLVPHAACSMIFTEKNKSFSSGSAWLPLLYDTVIFILTFYRAMVAEFKLVKATWNPITKVMLAEGLMYYSVICAITLILIIMISVAEPGIQNITAQLELLLTVAMMSRITIDLKKSGAITDIDHGRNLGTLVFRRPTNDEIAISEFGITRPSPDDLDDSRSELGVTQIEQDCSESRRSRATHSTNRRTPTPSLINNPVTGFNDENKAEEQWIEISRHDVLSPLRRIC